MLDKEDLVAQTIRVANMTFNAMDNKFCKLTAKTYKRLYDAYVTAGFSNEEAIQLVVASMMK